MKQLTLLLLLLLLLVGCGKSEQAKDQPSSETAQNKQQQTDEQPSGGTTQPEQQQSEKQPSQETEQEAIAALEKLGAKIEKDEDGKVKVDLRGREITDADLSQLKDLKNLNYLNLDSTKVTDAGLEHLKGLKNLRKLYLGGTRATAAGVAELQKALPHCSIPYPPTPTKQADDLGLYCAAGMRYPMEEIITQYQEQYGVRISAQFQGSNTLLAQIEVSKTGDLYLAADSSYVEFARQKGLAVESLGLARMKPVIVIHKDNKTIHSIDDLLSPQHRVALGNPNTAAIGKKTRKLLTKSGHWEALNRNVTRNGVYKPTVNEVANDVKLGSVHAGIIWDSVAVQFKELKQIPCPELDAGEAEIQICVLKSAHSSVAALKFARFVAASDRGLQTFAKKGFRVLPGDIWQERPVLTFFAGSVNRRALEPIIKSFEEREGVQINRVYNDCGILMAQMRMIKNQGKGFPDTYMASDVHCLKAVQDLFEEGMQISDTDIVLVVQKGNPKQIKQLKDLAREGIRLAIGHPQQCTIGVLSRRLLEEADVFETIRKNGNIVTETASSALLIPNITTGAADVVLAYRSDTIAEQKKLEVVPINSNLAKAIQPYSISRSTKFRALSGRLLDTIARSRDKFEEAGFNWRLDQSSSAPSPRNGEKK